MFIFLPVCFIYYMLLTSIGKLERKNRIYYKKNIIHSLITKINSNYVYNHNFSKNKDVEEEILSNYNKSCFDRLTYSNIYADDYISGTLSDGTSFKLADVSLIDEEPVL